jgi:hydrogenase small subunit
MTIGLPNRAIASETHVPSAEDSVLDDATVERLRQLGISRRRFISYCSGLASLMALPQSMVPQLAAAATSPTKPSVIYHSFQECTGCLESMVNSFAFGGGTSIENLILNLVSLDYQETLMAAAGAQAELQLKTVASKPGYVLIVDGSIPAPAKPGDRLNSGFFISGGKSGAKRFAETAKNAGLIIAVGTCASFGGLPKADPNPTGAMSIGAMMAKLGIKKPLINVSGCPPIPEVITGVILYYLAKGMPKRDTLGRPLVFYGDTVHDDCYREEFFEEGPFVQKFDDKASRKGGCLYMVGCKGPVTYNACSSIRWNQGTSFPMMSGHGCIGCSEPDFWDRINAGGQKGFYIPLGEGNGHGHGLPCSTCHNGEDDD